MTAGVDGYGVVMPKPDKQMVDDVLQAIRSRRDKPGSPWPYELLADRYPADAVLALMNQLDDADILDYGVSLRSAWVCDYYPDIEAHIDAFKRGEEYEPTE